MTAEPYCSPSMLVATGETVRPGGLDLTRRALILCGLEPGARVLDMGCGSGATVQLMRREFGLEAQGIDPSQTMICRGLSLNPGLPLRLGDAGDPPFEDSYFDGVTMECALSITARPQDVLLQARRVLRTGGRLVLTDMYLLDGNDQMPRPDSFSTILCLRNAVTSDALEKQLQAAGFRLLVWEDHMEQLKRLAVDIIMKFGSLAAWVAQVSGESQPEDAERSSALFRGFSYYLAIAEKS